GENRREPDHMSRPHHRRGYRRLPRQSAARDGGRSRQYTFLPAPAGESESRGVSATANAATACAPAGSKRSAGLATVRSSSDLRLRHFPLQARGDGGVVEGGLADDHQGRFALFAGGPGAVEIGGEARADGLDGEAHGRAGDRGKALQAQDVVGPEGALDGGQQARLVHLRQSEGKAVEIVVLVAVRPVLEFVRTVAAGEVLLAGEAEAEERREI